MRAQTNASRLPRTALLTILRAYKYAISPRLLPACRYVPTCSDYAAEAVERHGAVRGAMMAAWRLLRCHPFAKGGFDPVPNQVAPSAVGPHRADCAYTVFAGEGARATQPRHNWRAAPTPPEAAH